MAYSDLIRQEGEYTYSANVQFDIENDKKLLRFIPNETTIKLLREYFTDIVRAQPFNHARILYGSYGTGKSHFLTVLSQILSKTFTDGVAYATFLSRVNEHDNRLAADIDAYNNDEARKPLLIVPIVFDFEDFDRCIYFSLKKKLDSLGIRINFKTFYDQAKLLLAQWKNSEDSSIRLNEVCKGAKVNLKMLEKQLAGFDPSAEKSFNKIFSGMTFGVKYVYEVSNMAETLDQANEAIANNYSGIVFLFDEFGRYIEDNLKSIKVKSIQNLAEYCDHCEGNDHILLVSHKEISLYTQKYGKSIAAEWKKVEGRFKADSINNKQDQCLSLIRNILIKNEPAWENFKEQHRGQLDRMYAEAMDFKGFLINVADDNNPFEVGFPLNPIALFSLDRLSKKVAQNDRTFFTYLASKEDKSLYRFLISHEIDEFHFIGIDNIYDYFEPNIKSVQSDISYEWYKNLQTALAKNHSDTYDDTPEVKILKVIATIGIINDSSALVANEKTILSTIDCPKDILKNALVGLSERKIIKYSGTYDKYDFFDASIYDVEAMIAEESIRINEEAVIKALNDEFVKFVLYPNEYNRVYKISRVFIPVFALVDDLAKRTFVNRFGAFYDGMLILLLSDSETSSEQLIEASTYVDRSIVLANRECAILKDNVKKYIAAKYLATQKTKYMAKDPAFEKELQYNIQEITATIDAAVDEWKGSYNDVSFVLCNGQRRDEVTSYSQMSSLASELMFDSFPSTLIVNNELINKNVISGSIATAKKNAIRAIIKGEPAKNYYSLQYLSPDYIAVRSVLVKNGFIDADNSGAPNILPNGERPQDAVLQVLSTILDRAKKGNAEFGQLYSTLKEMPFGLRDGYLSLLLACILAPYKKSLIISSHDAEQETTAELFEEIVRRPSDFSFTVANWSKEQLAYMDELEHTFSSNLDTTLLAKNRLKAIYEAMLSNYKAVSKFARTTQNYVSDQTKAYRLIMERSYTNYSKFFFNKVYALAGDYSATLEIIKDSKSELEQVVVLLCLDLKKSLCRVLNISSERPLVETLEDRYAHDWVGKRQKSFDYYTNAFLGYIEKLDADSDDEKIIYSLSKSLTGIEMTYWNDHHKEEFIERIQAIKAKLDAYEVSDVLHDNETKMALVTANGEEKTMVFNNTELSDLGETLKNKINSTFGNFGLAVSYDDKVQVLLSLLNDLMEGK